MTRSLLAACLLLCSALGQACQSSQGQEQQEQQPAPDSAKQPPPAPQAAPPRDPTEDMQRVAGGTFQYGASEKQFEAYLRLSTIGFPGMKEQLRKRFSIPARAVSLSDFFMDPFEVTNQQFQEFLQATGYRPADPAGFLHHWEAADRYPEWAASFPVVWVSPQDAQAYCEWRGGGLPTDQEWERAARGDDGRYFPWGNKAPSRHDTAVFAAEQCEPVGNRPGDISPYDIYDMGGNVSEWTSTKITIDGVLYQLARGGNFRESAREMLTFNRRPEPLSRPRNEYTGFRCAATAEGVRNQESGIRKREP